VTATEETAITVNYALVQRLAQSWQRRAAVRTRDFETGMDAEYDSDIPDYPVELLPFAQHPRFLAATPAQRQRILTEAWLVYNERVIVAEEYVANPALRKVMHGVFPGADNIVLKKAVQQTLIDEHFHTYIHMLAVDRTRHLRRCEASPRYPRSVTYQRLLELQAQASSTWERHLLCLVWTAVSEVSINAYLRLLSNNDTIQPMHTLVTRLHDRDEAAHGRLMIEVTKSLYLHMTHEQRHLFVNSLRPALDAFVIHDFSAWSVILNQVGLAGAEEILADCEHHTATATMVRDFSGLSRLAQELDLMDQLEFEFPTNPTITTSNVG
jgi:4-aminobenzoate N-oxygenase